MNRKKFKRYPTHVLVVHGRFHFNLVLGPYQPCLGVGVTEAVRRRPRFFLNFPAGALSHWASIPALIREPWIGLVCRIPLVEPGHREKVGLLGHGNYRAVVPAAEGWEREPDGGGSAVAGLA
jgi:hypothetical protein